MDWKKVEKDIAGFICEGIGLSPSWEIKTTDITKYIKRLLETELEKENTELKEQYKNEREWKLIYSKENTELKKQLAITKEKIIEVLEDYLKDICPNLIKDSDFTEQVASEILGDDNEK